MELGLTGQLQHTGLNKMSHIDPVAKRAYFKKYRSTHLEQCKKYRVNYYSRHKEKELKRIRKYKETFRGRLNLLLKQISIRTKRNHKLALNYLCELYDKQKGKCALSGVRLRLIGAKSQTCHLHCMSIDRIKTNKGYVEGNVRLVTFQANVARQRGTDKELLDFCRKVIAHAKTSPK